MAKNNKKTKTNPKGYSPPQRVIGNFKSDTDTDLEAKLAGDRYLVEFEKMSNDPICAGILLGLRQIFKTLDWKAENDPLGLLEESLKNVNFVGRLDEITEFLDYGFSVFEVTYKQNAKGYWVWDELHVRPQATIKEFVQDTNGKITSITQVPTGFGGSDISIPYSRCLHFALGRTTNRPKGKSILRGAYRPYYYRSNIEKLEAIGIERDLTGLPVLTAPDDADLTKADGTLNELGEWAWNTVRNIKRNEQAGLVLPPEWKFDLQGSPGQGQFDLGETIRRYDANIAMSMLAQFLLLGIATSSGSLALGKEQSSLFYKAVEGIVLNITNVINFQFIGTQALQAFNGLKEQPILRGAGAEKLDLTEIAAYLARLAKLNMITPDDELEKNLRDKVSLPPRDIKTSRKINGNEEVEDDDKEDDDLNDDKEKKDDDENSTDAKS